MLTGDYASWIGAWDGPASFRRARTSGSRGRSSRSSTRRSVRTTSRPDDRHPRARRAGRGGGGARTGARGRSRSRPRRRDAAGGGTRGARARGGLRRRPGDSRNPPAQRRRARCGPPRRAARAPRASTAAVRGRRDRARLFPRLRARATSSSGCSRGSSRSPKTPRQAGRDPHARRRRRHARAALASFPGTVILHCFSSPALLEPALERGWYLSFAGNVTYPKAPELREAARRTPADRLLAETDSPYLAPQAVRGRRNEPANVLHTLAVLAEARGQDARELERQIDANATAAFGL